MSKKLLALGVVFGLAACGGADTGEEELELETEGMGTEQTAPATTVEPMDTSMMMDTTTDGAGMNDTGM